ncbi:MAG TPA: inositol monophosphatase family protein [Terriglobales bacterium]|nr:inositol monophosphatase family protein [Terriglobales bacterium]
MPNSQKNPAFQEFTATAAAIAREAGAILMQHRGRVRIEYKGEADLVTAADRASEAHITARLRACYPDHVLIGEEGGRAAGGGKANAEAQEDDGYCWYIDPLDGTTNYAHGLPFFAVSMGLQYHGQTVAAAVYNPPLDEMFTATAGGGAQLNGHPIAVSPQTELAQSLLATGFPSRKRHLNPNIHFYYYFSVRTHGMRRLGAAALDLCYTACGRFEGFWEFHLKPWDTAAGGLIVTEAGGALTDIAGAPHQLDSPEVLASNGHLHAELLAVFTRLFGGEREVLPAPETYFGTRVGA